jgi:hypothetical protein
MTNGNRPDTPTKADHQRGSKRQNHGPNPPSGTLQVSLAVIGISVVASGAGEQEHSESEEAREHGAT